jgi:hypothetical protein
MYLSLDFVLQKYKGLHKKGNTACVALIRGNQIIVGNVGDSRCVLSRNGQVQWLFSFQVSRWGILFCHNDCVQVESDNSYIQFIGRQLIYPPITSQMNQVKEPELKLQEDQ